MIGVYYVNTFKETNVKKFINFILEFYCEENQEKEIY